MKVWVSLLLLAITTVAAVRVEEAPIPWSLIQERFFSNLDQSAPQPFFQGIMQNFVNGLPENMKKSHQAHRPAHKINTNGETPFAWIPVYTASGIPSQPAGEWSAACFANNTISAELAADGTGATVTITPSNPTSLLCSDWYFIGTVTGVHIEIFDALNPTPVQIQWTFPAGITPNEMLDIKRNGFRVFMFNYDIITSITSLYNTAMLFLPAMTGGPGVPQTCAAANLAFLQDASISMPNRTTQIVEIDQSLINSGDFFGVIRLDGLDPMLAWAMGGSHTGHTTIAMRKPNGDLMVCESTAKGNYWPTNGIQCTPYATWITQAQTADFNVVWLPLAEDVRAQFNETAAWDFINAHLGLNYGYGNLLWGWVDSESGNYPPGLTWQLHQMLPMWLEKLNAPTIADLLWNQAWNFRLGTTGLSTTDLYAKMYGMGLTFGQMVALPEQDDWMYKQVNNNNETVYGRSMVCDVFVCAVWKAGNVFGDTDFQCTEATNWDIYSLSIFDPNPLLPQCTAADPGLPFCQLNGAYQLSLPYWNTRQIYTNSFNNCPRGSPPDYDKPVGC